MRTFEIEIIEGHDPSSYFWFHPAVLKKNKEDDVFDVKLYADEISIEEDDILHFLYYFFKKYFDTDLEYNVKRDYYDISRAVPAEFEWYLEYNFYTYEAMERMLNEIDTYAYLFENDYDNPLTDELKKSMAPHFNYISDDEVINLEEYIQKGYVPKEPDRAEKCMRENIGCAIDFYKRFTARMRKMMNDNPDACVIAIMGP